MEEKEKRIKDDGGGGKRQNDWNAIVGDIISENRDSSYIFCYSKNLHFFYL